jgi:hypothetical protein
VQTLDAQLASATANKSDERGGDAIPTEQATGDHSPVAAYMLAQFFFCTKKKNITIT